jgi:hypothetical protein
MASWPDEDEGIDAAIDAVARQMTEGASPADLRARVLARVEARGAAARWRSMWIVSPLAAAAVVLLAIVVLRTDREVPLKPDATRSGTPPSFPRDDSASGKPHNAYGGGALTLEPNDPVRVEPDDTNRRFQRKPDTFGSHLRPAPNGTSVSEIAALAPPAIELDSIVLGELAPPVSIEIEQLEPIAPIAVTPLGEGDR